MLNFALHLQSNLKNRRRRACQTQIRATAAPQWDASHVVHEAPLHTTQSFSTATRAAQTRMQLKSTNRDNTKERNTHLSLVVGALCAQKSAVEPRSSAGASLVAQQRRQRRRQRHRSLAFTRRRTRLARWRGRKRQQRHGVFQRRQQCGVAAAARRQLGARQLERLVDALLTHQVEQLLLAEAKEQRAVIC